MPGNTADPVKYRSRRKIVVIVAMMADLVMTGTTGAREASSNNEQENHPQMVHPRGFVIKQQRGCND